MAAAIALLVFFFTVALVLLIERAWADHTAMGERIRGLFPSANDSQPDQSAARPGRTDMMPTVTRIVEGRNVGDRLVAELSSAGILIRPSEFIGIIGGSFVVSQIMAMLFSPSTLGYVIWGIIGISIPIWVLRHKQAKRRLAFDHQIADALVMMASSLRSGFSFLRAMQMVAHEMPPPISRECERVVSEVNVGRPLEDALRSVVTRVQSYDFDLVVTAVLIQQQVGGNLADIFDTIAATMRDRSRVMGEVNALTAEGRLTGVILVLLPIFLGTVMVLLNPVYMSVLFRETIGHYLLAAAATLQIIGGLIIRKMLVLDI